jgi:phenylpropionate dioxygenase-like ring-hydroxylating dioxygenase large terminal subunit
MKNEKPLIDWPKEGATRAPYRVMNDPEIYRREMAQIFHGPTWHYLCLEAEIPEPGDYRTSFIGETPIIVVRDESGAINALVNRCAHKGALLCIEPCGKRKQFACVYHAWTYDLKGNLTSIAFQRGLAGAGGMPADFDLTKHGLERVRVENFSGMIFGTFSAEVEDVETYLGPDMAAHARRIFNRPVEVIGYYHQILPNNWKLYMENSRDPYHATILHAFYATFKLNRLSMLGGVSMGHNGWHNLLYSAAARDIQKENYEGKGLRSVIADVGLADSSFLTREQEFDDGITVAIQSIFPTCNTQQIYNTLAIRQTVPLGVEKSELHWTVFGYKDDDPELRRMRNLQANLIGPAGYVSMEDGSVGGYVQRGIAGADESCAAVMEMGGRDIKASPGVRATETALRGFWQAYRDLMGF